MGAFVADSKQDPALCEVSCDEAACDDYEVGPLDFPAARAEAVAHDARLGHAGR